tara:strand:- start:636 stop:740 length:105 start_codon:yes stop_codon:yes gene_type:complete
MLGAQYGSNTWLLITNMVQKKPPAKEVVHIETSF